MDATRRCDGSNSVSVSALIWLRQKLVQRAGIHPYSPAARTHPGTKHGVSGHPCAGLLATVGVAAGLSVHAIVAALGLGVLISEAPLIYDLLRWIGVGYLLYLAWETLQSSEKAPGLVVAASSSLFWRGFLSNVFNPKSIMFFISVVPGFIQIDSSRSGLLFQAARLGAVYVAIATTIHASIVLLASHLRPLLIGGTHQRSVRRMMSLALVMVAAWLAWSTRRI